MIDIVLNVPIKSLEVADPLMTIADAATYCRVSQSTVKKWLREDRLPAVRVTSDARIRRSDLNHFILQHRDSRTSKRGRV